jgi:hypothetical protein
LRSYAHDMPVIDSDSVDAAFSHLKEVALVHKGRMPDEVLEAIQLVMESFGVDEEAQTYVAHRISDYVPEKAVGRGWMLLGVIIGLAMSNNSQER